MGAVKCEMSVGHFIDVEHALGPERRTGLEVWTRDHRSSSG